MTGSRRLRSIRAAFFTVVIVFAGAYEVRAQLRIATYNTGNADAGQTTARLGMDTVLEAIGEESVNGFSKPLDVLVLQEQFSVAQSTQSFVNVLNGIYGGTDYQRGTRSGTSFGGGRMGIVYNSTTVSLIEELAFGALSGNGQLRQTLRYQLRPVGYDSAADFYIYVDHYKAGSSAGEQQQRLVEAQSVRSNADALGEGAHIIYAGDFNIRSSGEAMYQHLLSDGNGEAFDPINNAGTWHNSWSRRITHTQSPAASRQYPGQVLGGIDDRFDFQLVSGEFDDGEGLSYIEGSYHAFGNNGTHICCNSSITSGNGASTTVLNALMSVSDHLPVVADYQVPAMMEVEVAGLPPTIAQGDDVVLDVTIANIADVAASIGADELDYTLSVVGDLMGGASGIDPALGGGNTHQITLDTSAAGAKSGVLTVTSSSQAAANADFTLPIDYLVEPEISFAAADFDEDGDVDQQDLLTWQVNFGLSDGGDTDNDLDTDGGDLIRWQQQSTLPSLATAVPEPSSIAAAIQLLLTAGLGARGRRAAGPPGVSR